MVRCLKNLKTLADMLSQPLYAVGGVVRNFLIDGSVSKDVDLAGTLNVEAMLPCIERLGLPVLAKYKRTGTLVFGCDGRRCEYTTFRTEKYKGGEHTPYEISFTNDIVKDARRRDFKCNAVYFDLAKSEIIDPLGGVLDIKNKVLDTVIQPDKVFCSDGLRLMRLARFVGELGFSPTQQVLDTAKQFANNILDVSVERVYAELKMILVADSKYEFSSPNGHYLGLKVLDDTRVLDKILPELTKGRGMAQRLDFHNYDVLEHSLKTVLYSNKNIRLAALLHDVGKPCCMNTDGNFYRHGEVGQKLVHKILTRLKASNQTIKSVESLVGAHMLDLDCQMKESKVRLYIAKNSLILDDVLELKQADYKACKDQDGVAPTVAKWKGVLEKMKLEGAPFTLKQLNISAEDLIALGYKGKSIGEQLEKLFRLAVVDGKKNDRTFLLETAKYKNNKEGC